MSDTAFPLKSSGARSLVTRATSLFLVGLLLAVSGCTAQNSGVKAPEQRTADVSTPPPGSGDKFFVVDCLLPPRVRKLGRQLTFLEQRRPIKASAQECEIRGGEYVSYDRSDLRTSLRVWLEQAKTGDAKAQTYVGEIFEKGLGVPPDYATAAGWYRKAADQGYERAQINLGHLYEKGLGVEKDPIRALDWYRKAAGLHDAIALDSGSIPWPASGANGQEVTELRQEIERWKRESASLQGQLKRTQQQLVQTRQEWGRRQSNLETEQRQLEQAQRDLERRKQQTDAAAYDAAELKRLEAQLLQREADLARQRQEVTQVSQAEWRQLEQARQDLERRKQQVDVTARDTTEFKRLEAQLQQREAELARQRQDVTQMRQEMATLEDEAARHRTQLAKLEQQRQQVAVAGPTIEIIDPPLVGTRGLFIMKVSSEIVGRKRTIVGRVTSPAGLLNLIVNDRQERVDDNGLFRVPIKVQRSKVAVKVVAIDKRGKRASVEFQVTPNGAASSVAQKRKSVPAIGFGTYHALIIGNQQYTEWPDLQTPENDARKMAEVLSEKYGFKTRVLLNATRFDILQALNALRKKLTDKDNLLLYYAGHGYYEEKILRGYWVPVDGHTDSNVNWISTVAITDILGAMSVRHVLVVADSCYAGALTRSALARLEAGQSEEARQHWLEVVSMKRSRTVLTAGGLQPVLDSGGGDHSVFAKAFLDVLRENTEILEGQRLHNKVKARVLYAAAAEFQDQLPEYAPLKHAGHEAGEFIFVPEDGGA